MAVPFDLASLPDLSCSPALRPLVHGAAGDEKHDPIRKIYVRSALSRSVLDSAAVYAASGLYRFKGNAVLTPLFCRFQYQKGPSPENSSLLFCPFLPQPVITNPPCAQLLYAFLLVDIGLYEKCIYLFTCKCSIFSRWRAIFVLLSTRVCGERFILWVIILNGEIKGLQSRAQ